MTSNTLPASDLTAALETFRATRSMYPSSSEEALTRLVLLLADEVIALRQNALLANSSIGSPGAAAGEQKADLDVLYQAIETLREAHLAQQTELKLLRAHVGGLAPSPRQKARRPSPMPTPYEPRTMEYWSNHVPDYGDGSELTPAEAAEYMTRPRVRPEDIPITPREIAQQSPRRRYQWNYEWNTESVRVMIILILILAALIFGMVSPWL